MKTITAIHETGNVITINREAHLVERTTKLMRECGYIEITVS